MSTDFHIDIKDKVYWLRRWKDYMSIKTVCKRYCNNPSIEVNRYDY